jgi:hypothetical protein
MRCQICNWADFSTSECLDQSEDFPGRNAVHYRKSIDQDVCNYCFQQIQVNRRFYHSWGSNIDKANEAWGGIVDTLAKAKKVYDNKRPKQNYKKKVPTLSKPKVQVE